MKTEIPEELKSTVPPTTWGKVLTATPVVMTVVATMLAGLASSEMTRAQYDRALAAQQQSKAGDQWSFFQAKRLRGAIQRNSYEMLQATTDVSPLSAASLQDAVREAAGAGTTEAEKLLAEFSALVESPGARQALTLLANGETPPVPAATAPNEKVKPALEAVEFSKPEREIVQLLESISSQELDREVVRARDRAQAFDTATKPMNQVIDRLEMLLASSKRLATEGSPGRDSRAAALRTAAAVRSFTAARLQYAAQRYEIEARLNQVIANLYELQVRQSNHSAERHHARSQRFFFGMLAAQAAVIIATFAIAARQRNLLWSLAAAAGVAAIALAIYVYVFV
jgi:hypothetical protein